MALGVGPGVLADSGGAVAYSRLKRDPDRFRADRKRVVLAFALLLFGWKWPRYGLLIFAPGLLLVAVGLSEIRR